MVAVQVHMHFQELFHVTCESEEILLSISQKCRHLPRLRSTHRHIDFHSPQESTTWFERGEKEAPMSTVNSHHWGEKMDYVTNLHPAYRPILSSLPRRLYPHSHHCSGDLSRSLNRMGQRPKLVSPETTGCTDPRLFHTLEHVILHMNSF